jgi:chromate transporter
VIAATTNGRSTAAPIEIGDIFKVFLVVGATSFGGGVVAYLRNSIVRKHHWLNDTEFVEMLSISQTLPGLNATNMSVLIGDRLRGFAGASAAMCGMCLPGGVFMYLAAMLYGAHGERPLAAAALAGVAAAAVGLVLSTVMQLGRKALAHSYDLIFVAFAVIGINRLHQSVLHVLLAVGAVAILWYRPGGRAAQAPPESERRDD